MNDFLRTVYSAFINDKAISPEIEDIRSKILMIMESTNKLVEDSTKKPHIYSELFKKIKSGFHGGDFKIYINPDQLWSMSLLGMRFEHLEKRIDDLFNFEKKTRKMEAKWDYKRNIVSIAKRIFYYLDMLCKEKRGEELHAVLRTELSPIILDKAIEFHFNYCLENGKYTETENIDEAEQFKSAEEFIQWFFSKAGTGYIMQKEHQRLDDIIGASMQRIDAELISLMTNRLHVQFGIDREKAIQLITEAKERESERLEQFIPERERADTSFEELPETTEEVKKEIEESILHQYKQAAFTATEGWEYLQTLFGKSPLAPVIEHGKKVSKFNSTSKYLISCKATSSLFQKLFPEFSLDEIKQLNRLNSRGFRMLNFNKVKHIFQHRMVTIMGNGQYIRECPVPDKWVFTSAQRIVFTGFKYRSLLQTFPFIFQEEMEKVAKQCVSFSIKVYNTQGGMVQDKNEDGVDVLHLLPLRRDDLEQLDCFRTEKVLLVSEIIPKRNVSTWVEFDSKREIDSDIDFTYFIDEPYSVYLLKIYAKLKLLTL